MHTIANSETSMSISSIDSENFGKSRDLNDYLPPLMQFWSRIPRKTGYDWKFLNNEFMVYAIVDLNFFIVYCNHLYHYGRVTISQRQFLGYKGHALSGILMLYMYLVP